MNTRLPGRDEELVLRAVDGDEAAFAELARRYEGMVRTIIARYYLAGGDEHDLHQEALLGLHAACVAFDFSGRSTFPNFAFVCMERRVITALKSDRRDKHVPLNDAVRLEQPLTRDDPDAGTLADTLPAPGPGLFAVAEQRADVRALVDELPGKLTDLERVVLGRVLSGASLEQAGRGVGTAARPLKTADNAMQRVRRKARELLGEQAA